MLRSRAGRLYKGVAKASTTAPSLLFDSQITASTSYRHLTSSSAQPRPRHHPTSSASLATTALGQHLFGAAFHSDSYFSASQPDFFPPDKSQNTSSFNDITSPSQSERYLPPLLDIQLVAQNDAQQALFDTIQHLDADLSWHLYQQLGKARLSLPAPVIDLLITLQCRIPVRSTPHNIIDSPAAIRQVCDRALLLSRDKERCQAGSSAKPFSSANKHGLSTLSAALSLRLLYLLVVEEEQIAASRSPRPAPRRKHLCTILNALSTNIDAHPHFAEQHVDIKLRGRLAATLSRLGSTDAAFRQLQSLVHQASPSDQDLFIDPRPFDQLLSALARQKVPTSRRSEFLPSPLDLMPSTVDENQPILRALRLTLSAQVQASKANIHKCLQALDSATLWWLLPFELDGSPNGSGQLPDDRYPLKTKWHPWQSSADGHPISQDFLDSFAERVALVLAQRGTLQPALHIFDSLPTSTDSSDNELHPSTNVPDHDLFTVVLEQLAERMSSNTVADAPKSLDTHRGLSSDLHLAIKVYSIAHSIGVDLDSRINQAVIKAFSSCLPTAIVDLGPARARHTKFKSHIAQRNEQRGSRQALQIYLRRFTGMILAHDPDLSNGSLSFPAQATLLGLHMRTRDYTASKRLYQLIRLREPTRVLWSDDPQAGSLARSALHPLAAPDHSTFMWLFAESLRSAPKPFFALRLYLDWLASGNTLPSSLIAIFIQALLRAGHTTIAQRVFQELQEERVWLPARLARSLVASFAEAGYPDLAVEMACTAAQIAAATTSFQRPDADADRSSYDRDTWRLTSTLNLISIALDRSSRIPSQQHDADLHHKLLHLFDEFRLGLTHYLFGTLSLIKRDDAPQARITSQVTLQDVRMAYNAIVRVRLSAIMDGEQSLTSSGGQKPSMATSAVESSRSHIEVLFRELTDLGVEPDSDSWTLRLTTSLHACLEAPTRAKQQTRMDESLGLYEQASKQAYRKDGPLQPLVQGSSADRFNALTPIEEEPLQVRLHPAVVAALIDACRRCSRLESGLRVYQLHMRRSASHVQVEQARLMLLAALAEPQMWREELERLQSHDKFAFKFNERFVRQLEALSDATGPRSASSATR
ncbi:uncharacterized protein UTRI_04605_B [Ustilago trichophora]|uniref:Uncharacterized protein n=1 Tax=Ustilago trichophora TaxID=86804 RepID=A0A5C3EG70_9BASI|nr:uncharacterized protein UTRI_04605_B [Ustilago trichophora]